MPGPAGGKRKHGDRSYSGDDYSRPSPHRPDDLDLARQSQSQSPSTGRHPSHHEGRSRGQRGGRGRGRAGSNNSQNRPHTLDPAASPFEPVLAPAEPAKEMASVNPAEEPVPDPVDEPLLLKPYEYTFLTDEICENWQEQGAQTVTEQLLSPSEDGDDTQAALIVQELVHSVSSGRLAPTPAGDFVTSAFPQPEEGAERDEAAFEIPSLVIDAVSVLFEDYALLPFSRISEFLSATKIPSERLLHELDPKLLEKIGMIRNTFDRMTIRKQTNIVYRQANFNLMREESEGFAKLITEVFSSCSSEEPSGANVEEAVEKVKALIGAFDLDVGRSLDVVLDVFGSVLIRSFRFSVKFLRASPWWPRQPEGGPSGSNPRGLPAWALPGVEEWKLTDRQKAQIARDNIVRDAEFWRLAKEQGLRAFYRLGLPHAGDAQPAPSNDEFAKAWAKETGTLPPTGNRDAAQLLGFKLRFYSNSAARDTSDLLPDNLMFLSALLIKIGFISLKDLFPHLWRPDEAMDDLKAQKVIEKEERERAARPGAGVKNPLALAGALPDDTAPSAVPKRLNESATRAGTPSKDSETDKATKDSANEPADQKIALLKALLAIGALPEALFIIGRFPWVLDLIPELPEYFFRIINYSIGAVAQLSQPLADRPSLHERMPLYETDIPGLSKGQVKLTENAEPKLLRWAYLDKPDSADGTSYRFYWDEWNDLLPICQTVDDVFILFDTLLPLVGVKIGQDPELVTKIARIGKYSMKEDSTEANKSRWLELCKRILLPSISLTKANAGVVNEVFELLVHFPTKTRYLLYLEWRDGRTSRNPDVKVAAEQAKAETRDILKRISKTNARQMARSLAKVAYANPHIVTTVALNQIESYDSISAVFVEGSRYFTDLGYDVLTWNLIGSMAKAGRSNTQDGGIFASRWLTALSRFAGDIYKKYNMMKPGPILQYVARQLDLGNTMDLKMLENIVTSMGGITNDTSYNEAQLQAMGGGPLLQSQTILQLLDARHEKQATSRRLMSSLSASGLVGRFLLSMAQQRQACLYRTVDAPLKVVGNTYDEVHRVLVQYLDLLQHNLGLDSFADAVPDVVTLMAEYEIRPEIAFMICRSILSRRIVEYERDKSDDASLPTQDVVADIEMKDEESSEEDGEAEEDEPPEINAATPTENDIMNAVTESDSAEYAIQANGDLHPWHPVLERIMEDLSAHLPEEVVSTIGTGFYVTFWQLSLYDIAIPRKSYQDEMARQKRKRDAVKSERAVGQSATRRKEEQLQALSKLIDDLLAENGQHVKAQIACRRRLNAEKGTWFHGQARSNERLNAALWEHCFLPRILASPLDAYFCFAFVKSLHTLGTPNFRTLGFYDLLFRTERLTSLIFLSSAKEAEHFGRFLGELLKDLNRWHKAKSIYEKEAWGTKKELPGFSTKVEAGKPVAMLGFDNFRKILYKWHVFLHSAFQKCLKSTEYMHVRNAISVLHAVSEGRAYPIINIHGVSLQTTIDKLRASEMQDLVIASTSLLSALKRGEKQWISPPTFCPGLAKDSTPAPAPEKKPTSSPAEATTQVKKENVDESKDVAMVDVPRDTPQPESNKGAKVDAKSTSSGRLPARPDPANGVTTREKDERSSSRSGRAEAPRASLPRKLSPPPRHTPPASLPTRPEGELRNGHRESPRLPRPPAEAARSTHPRDIRDPRGAYRSSEAHHDDYERMPRRYDRPDQSQSGLRDDRPYPRDRDSARTHERPREADRDRERAPDRDRPSTRPHSRERDPRERSQQEPSSRQPNEDALARQSSKAPARPPSSQSESIAANPERAALIGLDAAPASSSTRGPPARADRAPPARSPRGDEDPRIRLRNDRDDRQTADRRPEGQSSRHPTSASGPGPRSDYPPRPQRDNRGQYGAGNIDMESGRLERDNSHHPLPRQDPSLDTDIPSGPRVGGMSAPRGRGGPSINTRLSHQPPSNERQTPTGPGGRHSRAPSLSEPNSAPPSAESTGVHPSRRAQLDSPIEPSRPSLPPPAGPRGRGAPVQAPSGPAPHSRDPPSGPAAVDGMGRGTRPSRNQMNAVNDTLAQAAHGSSSRGGRGGRLPSNHYPPHGASTSGPPQSGSERGAAPRSDNYPHNDLFASHNDPNLTPIGSRPPSTRQDSNRDRRPPQTERPDEDRRPPRRHDDPREHDRGREQGRDRGLRESSKADRDGPSSSRRDDRGGRRDEGPSAYAGEERGATGRGYRNSGPPRGGPDDRNDGTAPSGPGRKHPRSDENGPGAGQYPGGVGGGRGGGGGGGNRIASESKRPRRGG